MQKAPGTSSQQGKLRGVCSVSGFGFLPHHQGDHTEAQDDSGTHHQIPNPLFPRHGVRVQGTVRGLGGIVGNAGRRMDTSLFMCVISVIMDYKSYMGCIPWQ